MCFAREYACGVRNVCGRGWVYFISLDVSAFDFTIRRRVNDFTLTNDVGILDFIDYNR